MGEFADLLCSRPSLIVSLPRNDEELARAAAAGGADAIKVHINVHHDASGTHFGSFEEERGRLERILAAVDIPVGIVAGDLEVATPAEMRELVAMGFRFVSMYYDRMPAWMLSVDGLDRMVAVRPGTPVDMVGYMAESGMLHVCEAAIVDHQDYGTPLTVADLASYGRLVEEVVPNPVVVPTQRRIQPGEVPTLMGHGVSGIMIGAVVTGTGPSTLEAATADFAQAVHQCGWREPHNPSCPTAPA